MKEDRDSPGRSERNLNFLFSREGDGASTSSDRGAKSGNEQKRYGYPMVKGEIDYRVSVVTGYIVSVLHSECSNSILCSYERDSMLTIATVCSMCY